MKRALILILSLIMSSAIAAEASAFEKGKDYAVVEEIAPDRYVAFGENYPGSLKAGWPECKTGSLLKGTIITYIDGNGTHCTEDRNASYAFDGDPETYFDNFSRASYAALILDQAYELTEIRIHPCTSMPADTMFGMSIQGSNDGVHWIDIVLFNQDSHGDKYHIFTPQTVNDPDYTAAGYKKQTDESPFWRGTGAYSMYRYINQSGIYDSMIGEIELYGNPAEPTELDSRILARLRPTLTSYKGNINIRNVHVTPENGALSGTVIGAGGTWNKNLYENAFDNDKRTVFDPAVKGPECWAGLLLDEPAIITEVRVMPGRGDRLLRTEGAHIQGSNDGINWTSLVSFDAWDCVDEQTWIVKPVTDTNAYQYVRYVSSGVQHGDAAELLFFGMPASSAEETESAVPETSTSETDAVETAAPETSPSETDAVETAAPETSTSETDAVETAAPEITPSAPISPENQKMILAGALVALVTAVSGIGAGIARRKSEHDDD